MARPPSTSPLSSPGSCPERADSASSNNFSIYKGVSDRPIGWKQRRSVRNPGLGSTARDISVKRWDGAARQSSDWDCLRKVYFPTYEKLYKTTDFFVGSRTMGSSRKLPRPLVWTRSIEKRSSFPGFSRRTPRNSLQTSARQILGKYSRRITFVRRYLRGKLLQPKKHEDVRALCSTTSGRRSK